VHNCQTSAKAAGIPFPGVGHCRNCLNTFSSSSPWSPQICRWNFKLVCHIVQTYKYFRFWRPYFYFQVSVVFAVARTHVVELAVIEYPTFADGISILIVVVMRIKLLPVLAVMLLFSIKIVVSRLLQILRARHGQNKHHWNTKVIIVHKKEGCLKI